MSSEKPVIPKGVECPRCKGTGRERLFSHMLCGGCWGKGVTNDELCPFCYHPMYYHERYERVGIVSCGAESGSGQFICGCQGAAHVKSICNVCGKDQGNIYCLNRHLGESPDCKEGFEPQYYGR